MAGGKETPRQKMIGMMYLVLTALLALNVSKAVIAAFVTINDKIDYSADIINTKNHAAYGGFEKKFITDKAQGGDGKLVKFWQEKADEVDYHTSAMIDYLLKRSNEMIEEAEKQPWLVDDTKVEKTNPESGAKEEFYTELKPLSDIQNMDNYDIPTNKYIGGNPEQPKEEGKEIPLKIIEYRNKVLEIMATYTDPNNPKKKYSFTAPETSEGLKEALKTANPDDTAAIANFYMTLDIPEEITHKVHGHEETKPWPSVMFDHAPIVAAAAIFTSLKLDVRNAESVAYDFLLSKVDVQEFDFNKIDVMAFAPSSYVNQGDSIPLTVQVAAYDSTAKAKVKYGMDSDSSNQDTWKDGSNKMMLASGSPGEHLVKGVMYVKQRGVEVPKPWQFKYTVGQPMGVVALPEMRVLYRGYDNIVEGTASGFPPERVTLSGSGCSLSSKGKGQYLAKVGSGTREATISVSGKKEDGGSVNLGSFKFKVKSMPTPNLYLGGISNGQTPGMSSVKAQTRLSCRYDESVPLTNVKFSISGGTVMVDGIMKKGKVTGGGGLDGNAKSILRQAKGKQITILVNYKGPDGIGKKTALVFTPR